MEKDTPQSISLGFLDTPANNLILTAPYCPSKVGGLPVWLNPKDLPSQWCDKCEYKMTFLMQLYANIDVQSMTEYHRMLYVFTCLSEKCIKTQNSIKTLSCIFKDSDGTFVQDEEYNKVYQKTNNQLIGMGYKFDQFMPPKEEHKVEEGQIDSNQEEDPEFSVNMGSGVLGNEEFERMRVAVQNKHIIIDEYIIEPEPEAVNISKMYLKQVNKQQKGVKKVQEMEEPQSETDDDEEFLENMYVQQTYGTGKNDEKHVKELMSRFEKQDQNQQPSKEDMDEVKGLESVADESNIQNEMTQVYKLFNTVSNANPDQILRYFEPATFSNKAVITPLWASTNNTLP